MPKLTSHSKTGLFLMEMILSLLILSLAGAACIQVFASAYKSRVKARELNHIQELTTTVGEILEGSDGEPRTILSLLPDGTEENGVLKYYYNSSWQACLPAESCYQMHLVLSASTGEKGGILSFYDSAENELYKLSIRFPQIGEGAAA
ncbi:hypothetical protein NXH76_14430 [Blautia schinkii]|nr:hypothetical protein [Blautia schinkii]